MAKEITDLLYEFNTRADITIEDLAYLISRIAEPVVRCKDCKHMEDDRFCFRFVFGKTDPDGYCSWGERREDGKTD